MGFFDLFRAKGKPVGTSTVIKRMSAHARDFDGVVTDEEDHPLDVYECGRLDITGRREQDALYPCREKVSVLRNRIKKNQVVAFYLSPLELELEFRWRNGGGVKMSARLDRSATSSLSSWLLKKFRENGESVTAEALCRKLDGEFSSDEPPAWLLVSKSEPVAAPETSGTQEGQTVADLKVGGTVFGCHIEKQLGEGGQGQVFLATDTEAAGNTKQVVLKVLHENCKDEAARAEFIKEANTLSSLRDDRIAACYWCKSLGDIPVLAMEYIEGESLDAYLAKKKDGRISEEETRELLMPIAEALDYAHKKGIFHRDVKPQNIIVLKAPKRIGNTVIRTCLLDFGIASRDQGGDGQTTFWSVRGTLQYMSPEQKMIGRKPSASMDVYSLAVTAYECVMGIMPYPDGWERNVKPELLPSGSSFAKSVMRGLEMMPERRPQTCCELIDPPKVSQDGENGEPTEPGPGGETGGGKKKTGENVGGPEDIPALDRAFKVYRQLLSLSAQKCERDDQGLAEWLRARQAELRDLTSNLDLADVAALEHFFGKVKKERGSRCAEDFFAATDRIVELRASLPAKGGRVWRAVKDSIGK